jgi:hypothetical protein
MQRCRQQRVANRLVFRRMNEKNAGHLLKNLKRLVEESPA